MLTDVPAGSSNSARSPSKRLSSLVGGDVGERTEELVAAEAHQQVVRAHVPPEPVRDAAKHLVAGCVALLVVDGLEPIHVHKAATSSSLSRRARSISVFSS